jgi:dienelactone hydrolase
MWSGIARLALVIAVLRLPAALATEPLDIEAAIKRHQTGTQLAPGQERPPLVSFPGPNGALNGYLYRPFGTGPFPAMLWNHGSEKLPGWQPELAYFYQRNGFIFFLPHRSGHGRSPGAYIGDRQAQVRRDRPNAYDQYVVGLHEEASADVAAALDWLKAQSFVDPDRIVMSGGSYGGIQTLLAAERDMGVRVFIAFAPAAMSWANMLLRERLSRAVRNATAPIFLIQAANDFNIGPSEVLGPEVQAKHPLNRAQVYPAFGVTKEHGHAAFAVWDVGTEIWGGDVLAFIHAAWAQR